MDPRKLAIGTGSGGALIGMLITLAINRYVERDESLDRQTLAISDARTEEKIGQILTGIGDIKSEMRQDRETALKLFASADERINYLDQRMDLIDREMAEMRGRREGGGQ